MAGKVEDAKKVNKYFQWTMEHDVIMCREVLVSEPFKYKPRSPERGKVWENIAQQLNSIHQPKFRVSNRAVRDRYSLLTTKHAQKLKEEEKASGIDVEISELDSLLEEILEREKDGKARMESQELDKSKKAEKEKATAEEVRKQALERMSETKKRQNGESDNGGGKKKGRRSTSDAIDYLKEKSSKDQDLKEKELALRGKELDIAADKQQKAFEQQQTMMKAFMGQMQEQNKFLLALINKKKD